MKIDLFWPMLSIYCKWENTYYLNITINRCSYLNTSDILVISWNSNYHFILSFPFTIKDMLVFYSISQNAQEQSNNKYFNVPMCLILNMKNIVKHIKVEAVNIIAIKRSKPVIAHIYSLNICGRSWNKGYMTWFTILFKLTTMFTSVKLNYWKQNYQMVFVLSSNQWHFSNK